MHRLLALLMLVPLAALAQGTAKLSLAEAEALWRQHNHELQLAHTAVAGAAADVRAAGQVPNPQVSLNTLSISPWSGYGAGGWKDKKMDTQLRLDQVIERGGKRELRVKAAEARLDAARSDLDDTGRQQLLALQSAYYDLLLAQDRRRVAQDAADLYGKGLEAGKLRQRAGDISQVDLARLQIDKSRADNDVRQAQSDLEQAQAALAYLIGQERESRQLQAGDDWPSVQDGDLAASDLEKRPDVAAARQRLAAAESSRDLARAQKKRDVTVGVQLEHNLQNPPTNSYGFGVSLPLFVWHEYEGEIARAEADLDAARRQYAMILAQAVGSVDQARSVLLSARERRQRLETGLLADAERVAKAAEFAYSKGAMGLMDLLDARRTLRQVQVEAATARAEYAKALAAWRLQAEYGKEK
ncbi:MAG TPA: TolC family protein [Rhodocyclaceae bacterium]|nr:TolC family protein [Rhodocyclaceae bacterium]